MVACNYLEFGWLVRQCLQSTKLPCPSKYYDSPGRDRSYSIASQSSSPSVCSYHASTKCHCLEQPLALALSIVWGSNCEPLNLISDFLKLIGQRIVLSDICIISLTNDEMSIPYIDKDNPLNSTAPVYTFRGLVCYYGLHYVSIFQEYSDKGEARYILFDDSKMRVIGGWEDVKKECLRSRYQPVLLLYELEDNSKDTTEKKPNTGRSYIRILLYFRLFVALAVPSKHNVSDILQFHLMKPTKSS